jgi:2-polyprenyl-3-methyl-5-hydroxy-6-metoxy-1,4-benzoquinol methylase
MKLETERDVNEWVWAAKALAVVSAWNRIGLFESLRKGPVLRSELRADPRALRATIPVLLHLGLLVADGDRIGLTPNAERLLATHAMPTERNLDWLADLAQMGDVLANGGPVKDREGKRKATRGGTRPEDAQATERFLDMLYRLSEEPAQSTFTWLAPGLPAKASALDLGGGHGRYARAFADAGHEVTLFDQPVVIDIAKKRHGEVLRYLAGDFHTVESFGGPYDLVMLCNIVHGESPTANASIVARAAKSLRSGGRIAIRDMFLDEFEQSPPSSVFFGVTMLFYTENGTSPTFCQSQNWMIKAGLVDARVAVFETHQIVVARKP